MLLFINADRRWTCQYLLRAVIAIQQGPQYVDPVQLEAWLADILERVLLVLSQRHISPGI
jgi:hypothetical protein